MSTIHSLNKSISDMSDEEALVIVRERRRLRSVIPERKKAEVAKKRDTKVKSSQRTVDLLAAMSKEERLKLIKMLEDSE